MCQWPMVGLSNESILDAHVALTPDWGLKGLIFKFLPKALRLTKMSIGTFKNTLAGCEMMRRTTVQLVPCG